MNAEDRRLGVIGALFVVFLGFAALLFPGLTRLSFDLSFALRPTTPKRLGPMVLLPPLLTVWQAWQTAKATKIARKLAIIGLSRAAGHRDMLRCEKCHAALQTGMPDNEYRSCGLCMEDGDTPLSRTEAAHRMRHTRS